MKSYLTKQEAGDMFGVTRQSIENYCKRGLLATKKMGRVTYIDRESVEALRDTIMVVKADEDAVEAYRKELEDLKERYAQEAQQYKSALDSISSAIEVDSRALLAYRENVVLLIKSLKSLYEFPPRYMDIIEHYFVKGAEDTRKVFGVTTSRVYQIVRRTIARIKENVDNKIIDVETENIELREKVYRQSAMIEQLQKRLGKLQRPVNADRKHLLDTPLTELEGVNIPMLNILKSYEVYTLGDVVKCTPQEILNMRNMGKKKYTMLQEVLQGMGLDYGMDIDAYLYCDDVQ